MWISVLWAGLRVAMWITHVRGHALLEKSLGFPAVLCENLRLPNAAIPTKSENPQKSAKICEKLQKMAPFVPFTVRTEMITI